MTTDPHDFEDDYDIVVEREKSRAQTMSIAAIRAAIFDTLDAGDPERGGDPWQFDAVPWRGGACFSEVTVEDATENRWWFVEQVTERLKGKQQ